MMVAKYLPMVVVGGVPDKKRKIGNITYQNGVVIGVCVGEHTVGDTGGGGGTVGDIVTGAGVVKR
jgi:hypothetical protein